MNDSPPLSPPATSGAGAIDFDALRSVAGDLMKSYEQGTLQPTLRAHGPGYSAIAKCLEVQAAAGKQGRFARIRGVSPLAPEAWPWFQGALGEIEVGRELAALGPDWTVLHAVPIGKAETDVDHLVIGPGGVYVLNAKHHAGAKIWAGSWKMTVNGADVDHIKKSQAEGRRATELLTAAAGQSLPVVPVIVPVGAASVSFGNKPPKVAVVPSDRLVGWLRHQPVLLPPEAVNDLSVIAQERRTWHAQAVDLTDTLRMAQRFERLRQDIEDAKKRARSWLAIRRLLVVGPVLGGVAVISSVFLR